MVITRTRSAIIALSLLAGVMIGPHTVPESGATTIYSYIDDQGNPVFTDTPETIPEKYRAKVKTHEQPDSVSRSASSTSPTMLQSVKQTVNERVKNYGVTLPSLHMDLEGLSPNQSKILTYAGAAAVVLLLVMYISKSQLVRMLGFCLLVVVGIGAPLLMYVDDSGPMGTLKKQASVSGQAQQDRLQRAP